MMKMNRKKMMLTASALSLGTLLLAGGAVLAAPSGNYISSEKAQQIALENAGLSADGVTFIRTHLDYDDGRAEYEVEFYQGNMEYDYDIDAVNGTILSYDHDAEYHAPGTGSASGNGNGSVSANTTAASSSAGTEYITAETAKQAALGFPKETPAAWKPALITSMERPYTRLNGRSAGQSIPTKSTLPPGKW